MGTSFVELKGKGFWIRDGNLELWMRLVALHMDQPLGDSVLSEIRDRWLMASQGCYNGFVPINLDADFATKKGGKLVTNAMNSVLNSLADAPETLDKGVLNLIGFKGLVFVGDYETWRLIEVGKTFLELIAGRIPPESAPMPGSGEREK